MPERLNFDGNNWVSPGSFPTPDNFKLLAGLGPDESAKDAAKRGEDMRAATLLRDPYAFSPSDDPVVRQAVAEFLAELRLDQTTAGAIGNIGISDVHPPTVDPNAAR
jgi:hypothetical protein